MDVLIFDAIRYKSRPEEQEQEVRVEEPWNIYLLFSNRWLSLLMPSLYLSHPPNEETGQ